MSVVHSVSPAHASRQSQGDGSGEGRWDQPEAELTTRLERLQLGRYQGLLPDSFPVQLKGQLGGQVRVAWRDGRAHCEGGLSLADLTVSGAPLDHSLQSQQLRLSCLGDQLSVPTSRWVYGPYQARFGGGVRLNRFFDLKGALEEPNQDRRLAFQLDGPWRQPRVRVDGRWALPSSIPLDGPLQLVLNSRPTGVRGRNGRPRSISSISAPLDWWLRPRVRCIRD